MNRAEDKALSVPQDVRHKLKPNERLHKQNQMLLAIAILVLFHRPASADWQDAVLDTLSFALGMVAGIAIHEAGHALAARAYGEKLDWKDSVWVCRAPCPNIDQIAISGNLATAVVGEALLLLPQDQRQTPLVDGLQTFNTLNPISYAAKDLSSANGYGDYANTNNGAEVALAIHAASIGYRQFSSRLWYITPTLRGFQFNSFFN